VELLMTLHLRAM